MKIAITGANGFLGSATVHAAIDAGLQVLAVVRPGRQQAHTSWRDLAGVRIAGIALDDVNTLSAELRGCHAVIHAAAAKSGTYDQQYRNTVATTQALCEALNQAGNPHCVGIGSFAVYDYTQLADGDLLNEGSPVEPRPAQRDAYARAKLLQEQCFQEYAAQGASVSILRPGLIYGPGQLWQFFLGHGLGDNRWVQLGPSTRELPLTYVANCADAAVCAAQAPQDGLTVFNIVDDERPGRDEFIAKLNAIPALKKQLIRVPWWLWFSVARVVSTVNKYVFGSRLPVPGLLCPAALEARFKPLRYSNERAKKHLGWQPRISVDEALQRSVGR